MQQEDSRTRPTVQHRLLQSAANLFVNNDYHKVTTRMLAEAAETSTSSIAYYFGDKQKLYEAMIKDKFKLLGLALEESSHPETGVDLKLLLKKYLQIHQQQPDFPAFFTRILAYQKGPGYQLISEMLDKKREKIEKNIRNNVNVDILRILIMSFSIFPFLLKPSIQQSQKSNFDDELLDNVIDAAGDILNIYTNLSAVELAS